jgi:hypothetical protein
MWTELLKIQENVKKLEKSETHEQNFQSQKHGNIISKKSRTCTWKGQNKLIKFSKAQKHVNRIFKKSETHENIQTDQWKYILDLC